MPEDTIFGQRQQVPTLGLDPAAACGFAHSCGVSGVWRLGRGDRRLVVLRSLLLRVYEERPFARLAYELATYGSRHEKTKVSHNELLGVIRGVAAELGIDGSWGYHPATIKKFATGSGRASKEQVVAAARTLLRARPRDDNEADALWVMTMATQGYRPAGYGIAKRKPRRRR